MVDLSVGNSVVSSVDYLESSMVVNSVEWRADLMAECLVVPLEHYSVAS